MANQGSLECEISFLCEKKKNNEGDNPTSGKRLALFNKAPLIGD